MLYSANLENKTAFNLQPFKPVKYSQIKTSPWVKTKFSLPARSFVKASWLIKVVCCRLSSTKGLSRFLRTLSHGDTKGTKHWD